MENVHIIGIGGIAMSAIAESLKEAGFEITGSDLNQNRLTNKLQKEGIKITLGHKKDNISSNIDKVIYSDAIPDDNVEIMEAKKYDLELLNRSKALSWITKDKIVISATGTHGKTTTSSLIAQLFQQGGKEAGFIIGGIVNNFGSNFKASNGNYFILEGDEYGKSFLQYRSDIGVVTNIEFDHPDIYHNFEEMLNSYKEYIVNLTDCLVTNQVVLKQLGLKIEDLNIDVITVGINNNQADYYAVKIKEEELTSSFVLRYKGRDIGEFKIRALGEYNIKHALEAIAVAKYCGISFSQLESSLNSWQGVQRRFEVLHEDKQEIIITDYAHHPSEVEVVISSLERIKTDKKKVVIFQPHQYLRTKRLFDDYDGVLNKDIDEKIIYKIYKVREQVSGKELDNLGIKLSEIISDDKVEYYNQFANLKAWLEDYRQREEAIYLFLGAGDIDDFARDWVDDVKINQYNN